MNFQNTNRRRFISLIVPACFGAYIGMRKSSLFAKSKKGIKPQKDKHKFDQLMERPLSWKESFESEYVLHFIPYLKILEKEIGKEKVMSTLKKLARQEAEQFARDFIQAKGKNDLSVFRYYGPNTPGIKNMLTIEVIEDTEKAYEIKITECLWAKVFRDADASDYGYAAVCSGDVPFARLVNPKIDLDLQGTIMQGKPMCGLRYYV